MQIRYLGLAAIAAATIVPAGAQAAPVTVTLRVEGATTTVYEGPVTTDVRGLRFTRDNPATADDEAGLHTCDGTAATGGTSPTSVVTSGAALATAIDGGLEALGSWTSFGPSFSSIGGQAVGYDPASGAYLQEFLNGASAGLGACSQPVKAGDEVLFAFSAYGDAALRLTVPERVAPGATAIATVTNAELGTPVAGATVDGRTTGADGKVTIGPWSATGPRVLKAAKPGTVRSNGGQLCVTDGADGACGTVKPIAAPLSGTTAAPSGTGTTGCSSFGDDGRCGTPDDMPPLVRFGNVTSKTYASTDAPRQLSGQAGNFSAVGALLPDPSGLKDVRLRLTRYVGRQCWTFDGDAERFTPLKSCGSGKGKFFSVGTSESWSYLLPAALRPGKYRLEAFAIDGRGNADRTRRWNRNHVVFRVR